MLKRLLAHPATRGLDLDAPETTALRREIIRSKPFLKAIYEEWYRLIVDRVPEGKGVVLELGAGGGFLSEVLDGVVTSDVFEVPGVDRVIDARELPFEDNELKAIAMTNVFHHIPDVAQFLSEAQRTLRPGGRVLMIEPWNTWWSRFVHNNLHVEAMEPDAVDWSFPSAGPLSTANAALPWIVAERDRDRLESEWPHLGVEEIKPFMPFRYLASGGVSMRSLQPLWSFNAWKALEKYTGTETTSAVFALIVIEHMES